MKKKLPSGETQIKLDKCRNQISSIDKKVLRLVGARAKTARQIGKIKKDAGLPIRNLALEKRIYAERQNWAKQYGLNPDLIAKLWRLLISDSVKIQKQIFRQLSL